MSSCCTQVQGFSFYPAKKVLLHVIGAIEIRKSLVSLFGNKWNATHLLPLFVNEQKSFFKLGRRNYLYCNFPFLFWVVKYFLCCFQIGSTDVIYYMTQNFLHGIEIILENTSSLKRFSTLKATLEKLYLQ